MTSYTNNQIAYFKNVLGIQQFIQPEMDFKSSLQVRGSFASSLVVLSRGPCTQSQLQIVDKIGLALKLKDYLFIQSTDSDVGAVLQKFKGRYGVIFGDASGALICNDKNFQFKKYFSQFYESPGISWLVTHSLAD